MIGLTPRQRETLDFIEGFIEARRMAPTYSEIAVGIGAPTRSVAYQIVARLASKRYLRMGGGTRRIELCKTLSGKCPHCHQPMIAREAKQDTARAQEGELPGLTPSATAGDRGVRFENGSPRSPVTHRAGGT